MLRFDADLFRHRVFSSSGDFLDAAVETVELCPPETIQRAPAIMEGDLSSVTGVAPGVPLSDRIHHIIGGPAKLKPTMAYRLENVSISQGIAYSRTGRLQLRKQKRRSFGRKLPITLTGTTMMSCNLASNSAYYHWAIEQLPRELTANALGARPISLSPSTLFWHAPELRETLDQDTKIVDAALLKDCWFIQDRSKNSYFTQRLKSLRAKTVQPTWGMADGLVYLKRGVADTGKREIANDAVFTAFLEGLGFQIVDVETATLEEISTALGRARVTCTVEGSQAAHHFMYAREGAALLILMPGDRFNHVLKEVCDVLRMPFALVLGAVVGDHEHEYSMPTVERVLNRLIHGAVPH